MRSYRNMNAATKMKISSKLKGRTMSDSHRQAISDGMKAYWATIPYNALEKNKQSINLKSNETNM